MLPMKDAVPHQEGEHVEVSLGFLVTQQLLQVIFRGNMQEKDSCAKAEILKLFNLKEPLSGLTESRGTLDGFGIDIIKQ